MLGVEDFLLNYLTIYKYWPTFYIESNVACGFPRPNPTKEFVMRKSAMCKQMERVATAAGVFVIVFGLLCSLGGLSLLPMTPPLMVEAKFQGNQAEPSQGDIAKRVEETYRNLAGYLQFDYCAFQTFTEESTGLMQTGMSLEADVIMGQGAIHSMIYQDGNFVRALSLSPADGKIQEWQAGEELVEYDSPFPQGTASSRFRTDTNCLIGSCLYSFVGVDEWKNLGLLKAVVSEEAYNEVDKALYWRLLIEQGKRDPNEEAVAQGWGRDCYVYCDQMAPGYSNTAYVNKATLLVERWDSRQPGVHRVRRYDNIRIVPEVPSNIVWKINADVKKAEAKKAEAEPKNVEENVGG